MNSKSSSFRSFLLPFILAIFLLIGDRVGLLVWARGGIEIMTLPTRRELFEMRQGVGNFVTRILSNEAENEIKRLTSELARRTVDYTELQQLKEENIVLRRQLEAPFDKSIDFLPAHVVGIDNFIMTIDQGSENGAVVGMPVVSEKILVGQVRQVLSRSSLVYLPTHPESKIPAETTSGARGLIVKIGGDLILDRILQEQQINKGDIVVTSGSSAEVPQGLVIGSISKVMSEEQQLFKQALLTPTLSYDNLQTVFVVTKY